MKSLNEKLNILKKELEKRKVRIMIIGLGSVGNYLLDYLMSSKDEGIDICVVGRNKDKMLSDINIVKVASMIRGQNRSQISIIGNVDLENISQIADAVKEYKPDFIVNSSRAYPGLKYGSISWKNIRSYGIWTPLSIKYTRNIMQAYNQVDSNAIVINTSYSDAVIPWLKSAGKAYPDFGSGNINHLIPRFQFAVAEILGIDDYWNIDITFATAHFHDVVISKEGHTEGIDMLIDIRYQNRKVDIDILYFLFKSGEHNTSKDICDLNLFNKGHISQSVGRMVKQQLIYIVQDQEDRRCMHIMLTDKSLEIIEEITELRKQMYNIILKGVTEEERNILLTVSRKVNANVKDALGNLETLA